MSKILLIIAVLILGGCGIKVNSLENCAIRVDGMYKSCYCKWQEDGTYKIYCQE